MADIFPKNDRFLRSQITPGVPLWGDTRSGVSAALRTHHPAWRLLRSDHAALVASFLHRVFVAPNVRVMAAADLAEALEDELYALRLHLGEIAFPKPALDYLNDWAAPDKGWLRKFYRPGTDEAQFDLTPSTEKAIACNSFFAGAATPTQPGHQQSA